MDTATPQLNFILNDQMIQLAQCEAEATLLEFLRLQRNLTGTKEGCAEGDCGACTVLVGQIVHGNLQYVPVNSCIFLLPSIHRCHVVTIERLSKTLDKLHPVQQAMVDQGGSQCGFCTPGIVMALYALWLKNSTPSRAEIITALQGNLCRCTGYAPILRAGQIMGQMGDPGSDLLRSGRSEILEKLGAIPRTRVELGTGPEVIVPEDLDDFARLYARTPHARIVAGATDIGLWVTKDLRRIAPAIFIGQIDELKQVAELPDHINFGAAVSYTEAQAVLLGHFPQLKTYWSRIAGWQVRNMGTLGGNIANGSPIGDCPPVFIALGARLVLRKGDERREMPLEDFFIEYGRQDISVGEFVEMIQLPKPKKDAYFAGYKVSKRRDEDISTVAMGIWCVVEDGVIEDIRIACGGMAGIPKRARYVEEALRGREFSEEAFTNAAAHMPHDFDPLDDLRASASYRMQVAQNLLRRFYLENSNNEQELTLEEAL